MANILITANSNFEPFSFERYIRPYEIYTQAYKETENALSELSSKAEVIQEYINSDPYSKSASVYNNYIKKLDNEAQKLSSEGLKGSRGKLLQLKRDYDKSISPIIKKIEHKQKLAAEQREANIQANGALEFDIDYNSNSLDDVDVNKSYKYINLDKITEDTAKQVTSAAKAIINSPEYQKIEGEFDGQYIERKLQMGYSLDDILNEIGNKPGAPKELKNIRETIKKKLDLQGFDSSVLHKVDSAISNGMMFGVGEIKYEQLQNKNFISDYQKALLEIEKDKAERNELGTNSVDFTTEDGKKGTVSYKNGVYKATIDGVAVNPIDYIHLLPNNAYIRQVQEVIAKGNAVREALSVNDSGDICFGDKERTTLNSDGSPINTDALTRRDWNEEEAKVISFNNAPSGIKNKVEELISTLKAITGESFTALDFQIAEHKGRYKIRYKGSQTPTQITLEGQANSPTEEIPLESAGAWQQTN